jgi:hypothetical protein
MSWFGCWNEPSVPSPFSFVSSHLGSMHNECMVGNHDFGGDFEL